MDRDDQDFSQPPVPASVAASQAAVEAARGFRMATEAYNLDQLDIVDPTDRPAEGDAGASRPNAGDARLSPNSGQRPASPSPDPFTPEVLRSAAEVGITAEEARAFGDPAHLQRAVNVVYRQRRPAQQQVAEPAPQQQTLAPEEPQFLDLASIEYPAGAVDAQGRPLTGKEFDPRLVEAINQRDKFYQERIAALEAKAGAAHQTAQQAAQEQVNQRYDAAFAAVPDEYKAAVGQGSYHALDENSPEYRTRMEIFAAAEGMRVAHAQMRLQPLPFKTLFDRALRAVLGGQPAPQPAPESGRQQPQRDPDTGRFLMRPTQRQNGSAARPPSEAEHRQWAVGRVAQRMREIGMLDN